MRDEHLYEINFSCTWVNDSTFFFHNELVNCIGELLLKGQSNILQIQKDIEYCELHFSLEVT